MHNLLRRSLNTKPAQGTVFNLSRVSQRGLCTLLEPVLDIETENNSIKPYPRLLITCG